MSHHGNTPNPELTKAMRKLLRCRYPVSTSINPLGFAWDIARLNEVVADLFGEFPDGKLNADDAGGVAMQIGVEDHRVVIRFAKPVAWMGMTGDDAFELAQVLLKHARRAGVTVAAHHHTIGGRDL